MQRGFLNQKPKVKASNMSVTASSTVAPAEPTYSLSFLPNNDTPTSQTVCFLHPKLRVRLEEVELTTIVPPQQGWPFEIKSEEKGEGEAKWVTKMMVASRDIAANEIIIKERPLVLLSQLKAFNSIARVVKQFPQQTSESWSRLPNRKGPFVSQHQGILDTNAKDVVLSCDQGDFTCRAVFKDISIIDQEKSILRFEFVETDLLGQLITTMPISKGNTIAQLLKESPQVQPPTKVAVLAPGSGSIRVHSFNDDGELRETLLGGDVEVHERPLKEMMDDIHNDLTPEENEELKRMAKSQEGKNMALNMLRQLGVPNHIMELFQQEVREGKY